MPIRTKSLEVFVDAAKERGCARVAVHLIQDVTRKSDGSILVPHRLLFKTETAQGRRMHYQKPCFIVPAFGNKKEREEAIIKLYLMGAREREQLKAQLPDADIVLIGHNGKPVDETFYRTLELSAKKYGITL